MKEIQVSFMTVIDKLNKKDSDLCKLKKKEISRATSQGTAREPSAPEKVPLSFQETAEDEKTARNRAILTAELKEKQARQRAEDKRLKLLEHSKERDEIRRVAGIREDFLREKKREGNLRRKDDHWEDNDRVIR